MKGAAAIINKINEALLLFPLFILPLFAGGKDGWTYHLMIATVLVASGLAVLSDFLQPKDSRSYKTGVGMVLISALAALSLLQLIPLPHTLANLVAPGTVAVVDEEPQRQRASPKCRSR